MSVTVLDACQSFLNTLLSADQVWIAYSGGVDSCVLLHALADIRQSHPSLKLNAIHIHHGLLDMADQWSLHCESICRNFNISYQCHRIQVNYSTGDSLEEKARQARYDVFRDIIDTNDVLLTAHHADDQAETCLLQFLRGSGPKGLAAMPKVIPFSKGQLIRPLLTVPREFILAYANQHQLKWIEDTSNQNEQFTRNFLRHRIIPLLKTKWPQLHHTISRTAQHCAEADLMLQQIATDDLTGIHNPQNNTLAIHPLIRLPKPRQKNAIRLWLQRSGHILPSTLKLEQIFDTVIQARCDASPCLKWENTEIRRYKNHLYVIKPLIPFDQAIQLHWNINQSLQLPANMGILSIETLKTMGITLPENISSYTVRFRQGGETYRDTKKRGCHTRELKKLFQEWAIPPWERRRIPLLYADDQLIAVMHPACLKTQSC